MTVGMVNRGGLTCFGSGVWRGSINVGAPRIISDLAPRSFSTVTSQALGEGRSRPTSQSRRVQNKTELLATVPRRSVSRAAAARADADGASGDGIIFGATDHAKRRNEDSGCVSFVTGANRGIGLEITRQLLRRTKGSVIAACRHPSSAGDLKDLQAKSGMERRLDVIGMDIGDQDSVENAADHARATYGRVDLLFNVAGILGDGKTTPGPERSLRALDREWLRHTLEINTVGPMMLTSALAPLMESPAKKGEEGRRPPTVICNFSARVGSIGDNSLGGWHSYRMSKSALNMATKGTALELKRKRVWVFSYHPGTTDTGLSKPFQANVKPEKLFTTEYTVNQVLGIVDAMTEDLSGGFFAFDGSRMVW